MDAKARRWAARCLARCGRPPARGGTTGLTRNESDPKVVEKGRRDIISTKGGRTRTIHTQTRRRRRLPQAVVLATKAAVQIPLRHRLHNKLNVNQHVKQRYMQGTFLGEFFWGPLACPGRRTQPSPCASLGSPLAAVAAARSRDLHATRLVKQPTQVRLAPARAKKLLEHLST